MILLQAFTVGFIGYALGTAMAATFFEVVRNEDGHAGDCVALAECGRGGGADVPGGGGGESSEHPAGVGAGAGGGFSRLNTRIHEAPQRKHTKP
jgi:hypothetical protein